MLTALICSFSATACSSFTNFSPASVAVEGEPSTAPAPGFGASGTTLPSADCSGRTRPT